MSLENKKSPITFNYIVNQAQLQSVVKPTYIEKPIIISNPVIISKPVIITKPVSLSPGNQPQVTLNTVHSNLPKNIQQHAQQNVKLNAPLTVQNNAG